MQKIISRALPERTKLMFYFPKPEQDANYLVVELPFFENVQIKENKKARYQKYSLISRSSNLYSYLGADSRNISVSFNMTLPHILDLHRDVTIDKYVVLPTDKENTEAAKKAFLKPQHTEALGVGMAFQLGNQFTQQLAKDSALSVLMNEEVRKSLTPEQMGFLKTKYGLTQASIDSLQDEIPGFKLDEDTNKLLNQLDAEQEEAEAKINNDQNVKTKYTIIDLIVYWTNIIRSSVVNYSKNPIYGPPIIRLRHGIMYQDIPCICTSYSIDYNEAAGYDLDTLLPRQLRVELKLEEIRAGDFGEFDQSNVVKKDNLAGWEAVVLGDSHTMDPGYTGVFNAEK
jgi:hypothetical protein